MADDTKNLTIAEQADLALIESTKAEAQFNRAAAGVRTVLALGMLLALPAVLFLTYKVALTWTP